VSIQVAITVDVEFTIGGAFGDPIHKKPVGAPSVECRIGEEGAGLDFILATLESNGLRGVFFVEALNTCYFGDEPMGSIARRIRDRGHDVQLHAHPCWTAFLDTNWQTRVASAPQCDSCADLTTPEIERVLDLGLGAFARWGLPAPIAFRAGNLQADRRIYAMLARRGVPLSSNVGLGTYQPREPQLCLSGGRHRIDGTLEIPVSSYMDVRLPGMRRWKTFTVIGTGAMEAREWLRGAAGMDIGPVVILTHPSEFVQHDRDDYTNLRHNDLARNRLRGLCEFLSRHPDKFEVVTFAEQVSGWTGQGGTTNPCWSASAFSRALRVVENKTGWPKNAS
jgi:hypothetical protein